MDKSKKYLLLLVLLYCLVRMPIILSFPETVEEDLFRGSIAAELLSRPDIPVWYYVQQPYGFGTLLAGLWTVPFFTLFGKSFFALKLAPFTWHLFSLIAWYFVWKAYFSPKQTFFILLFFVLSPPVITEYSLFNNGYHFEMILWMALSILLLRRILENAGDSREGGARGPFFGETHPERLAGPPFSNVFLLGLLGGFSSSLILTNLVTVLVILVYLALYKGNLSKRSFYFLYGLGFLIGFSPWILLQFQTNGGGIDFISEWFFTGNPFYHFVRDLFGMFFKEGKGFQALFNFESLPFGLGRSLTILTCGLYCISFLFLLKRKWPFWRIKTYPFDLEAFGLLFQILLVVLVAANRLGIDLNYYLFPMVPFIGMTLVTAFQTRWVQRCLVILFLSAGVLGNLNLIHFENMGQSLKLPGYSYILWSGFLSDKYCPDFPLFAEKYKKMLESRPLEVKRDFYQGLYDTCFMIKEDEDLGKMAVFIEGVEPDFQPILLKKFGRHLATYSHFESEKIKSLIQASNIKTAFYSDIYRGIIQEVHEWGYYKQKEEKLALGKTICETSFGNVRSICFESLFQ